MLNQEMEIFPKIDKSQFIYICAGIALHRIIHLNSQLLKHIIKGALAILTPAERKRFGLLAFLNFLLSLTDIFLLAMLLTVVCLYTGSDHMLLRLLPATLRDAHSLAPAFLLLLLFLIKNVSGYLLYRHQSRFFFGISFRLAARTLSNYQNSGYEQYVKAERAQLLNTVTHQPIEFAQNILSSIQTIVTELSLILITITAILIFKPVLFLLLLLFLLPPVLISGLAVKKKLNHTKRNISSDVEKANQYLNESFSAYVEGIIYNKKTFFSERYLRYQQRLSTQVSELQIIQWLPSRLVEVFAVLGLFALVLLNQLLGLHANFLDIGTFIAAAYKIMPGITRITNATAIIKTYQQIVPQLSAEETTATVQETNPETDRIEQVELEGIHCSYRGKPVLKHLNLQLHQGDFLFISGPSGTGKTTLLHILLGLMPPQQGSIRVNGTELTAYNMESYRSKVSYIKQQALILQDNLRVNISLQEKGADELRLAKAIRFAGLQTLIEQLPSGLDTVLADEGKDLSGGQKQRIAIARALYHEADLIVLDEPFNELDNESEKAILAQLKQLSDAGKMIILVSHSMLARDYCTAQLELSS